MTATRLHCFAQSGNAFKVASYLTCSGKVWEPVFVDFMAGATRQADWRGDVNEMGEVPVLDIAGKRLTQSGAILTFLAETTGRFQPDGEDERYQALRWLLWDNHKLTSYLATYRYMRSLQPQAPDPAVLAFLKGRTEAALKIANGHLATRAFMLGAAPTIVDFSIGGYLFYPVEEHGFDFARDYPHLEAWRQRMMALPGWTEPYALMPGKRFVAPR